MTTAEQLAYLREYQGRPLKLMEICGTHTRSIVQNGLLNAFSKRIQMVSGPGCPVCVTPPSYIDRLAAYAFMPGHTVLSFGDLLRVPGNEKSLAQARAEGGSVVFLYSPFDALALARRDPSQTYVFAAVGFETTAAVFAALADQIVNEGLTNLRLLTAMKRTPPAIEAICESESIDGFLCPGHVSVIIGSIAYEPLCRRYMEPFIVAGFTGEQIIGGVYALARQLSEGRAAVQNLYADVVSAEGNRTAKELMTRYFRTGGAVWRGLGTIPDSGYYLREEFRFMDAGSENIMEAVPHEAGCRCPDVLLGRITPPQCLLFGGACTPDNPVGPCMVSAEGACGIWYEGIV